MLSNGTSILALFLVWLSCRSVSFWAGEMSSLSPFGPLTLNVSTGVIMFLLLANMLHRFYLNSLCDCEALTKNKDPMSESQRKTCTSDLDRIFDSRGLSSIWKTSAANQTIKLLLTGSTGYIGHAVLYQLLLLLSEDASASEQAHKIVLLIRGSSNSRGTQSAQERGAKIRMDPMFAKLRDTWDEHVVIVEGGDISAVNCGLSEDGLTTLTELAINNLIHCAADVSFDRPLDQAASSNITSALRLQGIARSWPSFKRMVHVSTAFINPTTGTEAKPLPEAPLNLKGYDPLELYNSMLADQVLALEAKAALGFQNNYVFTKSVSEHLLVRDNSMELCITRPAVVGPAWVLPRPGWNGDKPSTATAMGLLWSTRIARVGKYCDEASPIIPVDIVAAGIVQAMVAPLRPLTFEQLPSQANPNTSVQNLIWSSSSPTKFLSTKRMIELTVALMTLDQGRLTLAEGSLSLALIEIVHKLPVLLKMMHVIFNRGPLLLLQFVKAAAKLVGVFIAPKVKEDRLLRLTEVVLHYAPFGGRAYYFDSCINVPESLDTDQYMFNLLVATDFFFVKYNKPSPAKGLPETVKISGALLSHNSQPPLLYPLTKIISPSQPSCGMPPQPSHHQLLRSHTLTVQNSSLNIKFCTIVPPHHNQIIEI
jgi:nucleoside-diphosphate-sugar epimerase